jgi:hypothetical protein
MHLQKLWFLIVVKQKMNCSDKKRWNFKILPFTGKTLNLCCASWFKSISNGQKLFLMGLSMKLSSLTPDDRKRNSFQNGVWKNSRHTICKVTVIFTVTYHHQKHLKLDWCIYYSSLLFFLSMPTVTLYDIFNYTFIYIINTVIL